jgi:hypothetical protein
MTITGDAAVALARARATGTPVLAATDSAHLARVRAAVARDIGAMLGVAPTHIVVTADPLRGYGGYPGHLITVYDPDDDTTVWQFIPETATLASAGGAYLLLGACPGCASDRHVPIATIHGLADLGLHLERVHPTPQERDDPDAVDDGSDVPVEFFDDPGHQPDCPLI